MTCYTPSMGDVFDRTAREAAHAEHALTHLLVDVCVADLAKPAVEAAWDGLDI